MKIGRKEKGRREERRTISSMKVYLTSGASEGYLRLQRVKRELQGDQIGSMPRFNPNARIA